MSESNEQGQGLAGLQPDDVKDMRVAALRYNAGEDAAPIVVAAGTGFMAQKILEIADECGISIYHDDSAATLLAKLKLGQEIPQELYQMVVDIYLTVLAAAKSSKQTIGGNKAKEARKKPAGPDVLSRLLGEVVEEPQQGPQVAQEADEIQSALLDESL